MQIEISEAELKLIISALRFLDPTGFFSSKLQNSLLAQIEKVVS
jgi:DNA-directed RNA polymerase specialized sigma54-like protein